MLSVCLCYNASPLFIKLSDEIFNCPQRQQIKIRCIFNMLDPFFMKNDVKGEKVLKKVDPMQVVCLR